MQAEAATILSAGALLHRALFLWLSPASMKSAETLQSSSVIAVLCHVWLKPTAALEGGRQVQAVGGCCDDCFAKPLLKGLGLVLHVEH